MTAHETTPLEDHRLQAAEAALHEREISFTALARVAPVGIMRSDPAGRCNYVNDRWTAITGLTIDQAIGDGWQRCIHPEDRATVCEHWRQLRDDDQLFREEYRVLRPEGTERWVLAEGTDLRAYSGEPLGFIRVLTDITAHRQLEAELSASRAELENRVRERTAALEAEMQERESLARQISGIKRSERQRFSQDLHDGLGQCLTGILFRTLALQRHLQASHSGQAKNASKIAELVNDAINRAHDISRGIQPVPPSPDGLVCALQGLTERLRSSELAECDFHCPQAVPVESHDAATHLYRIAQEALNNAIKHSGAKKMTVQLQPRLLTVRDNGCGFDGENSSVGRGLHIMRHRARLIGASLHLRSVPGSGTTVECAFPLPSR